MTGWQEIRRPGPQTVTAGGVTLGIGSRVRLRPRSDADVMDQALADKVAIVDGIEQALDDRVHVAVTLEDDPTRDLGRAWQVGHRFFFSPEEMEPLAGARTDALQPVRILVAGIGNVLLGDDGFGVEVVAELARRPRPHGVDVVDFGIRGMDLTYALGSGYDAAILIDATPRGQAPGSVYVIEPEVDAGTPMVIDTHGMDPVRVLRLALELGPIPDRTLVVGCEPLTVLDAEDPEELLVELSAPVKAAIPEALDVVESLIEELVGPPVDVKGGAAS